MTTRGQSTGRQQEENMIEMALEKVLSEVECGTVLNTRSKEAIISLNQSIKGQKRKIEDGAFKDDNRLLFKDVIGNSEAKKALFENVVVPIRLKDKVKKGSLVVIRKLGKNSVLLHGPPGTGKTTLVQAAATEARATLISVRPSDILSKYYGESENVLKTLFEKANESPSPTILFFDEFDSLASSRGMFDEGVASNRRLMSELLLAMNTTQVTVVAATNRIEDIDEAAIRRFPVRICVDVPESTATRMRLISKFLRSSPNTLSHLDLKEIAGWTAGYSGSDIEDICREASMGIVRRLGQSVVKNLRCGANSEEDLFEPYDYEKALSALEERLVTSNSQSPEEYVTRDDFVRAISSTVSSVGFVVELKEEEGQDSLTQQDSSEQKDTSQQHQ